jgi:hypothetical protein
LLPFLAGAFLALAGVVLAFAGAFLAFAGAFFALVGAFAGADVVDADDLSFLDFRKNPIATITTKPISRFESMFNSY